MPYIPVPASFTLSIAAIRRIEWMREQCIEISPDDPPVMPGLSVGRRPLKDGSMGPPGVFVGFWCASGFPPEAYEEVQRVSGIDLVLAIVSEDLPLFIGTQLDYAPGREFFLQPVAR